MVLTYKDGKPQLVLKRANASQDNLRTVKMSPGIRKRKLRKAIPTIPIDAFQQSLSRPNILTEEALNNAIKYAAVRKRAIGKVECYLCHLILLFIY